MLAERLNMAKIRTRHTHGITSTVTWITLSPRQARMLVISCNMVLTSAIFLCARFSIFNLAHQWLSYAVLREMKFFELRKELSCYLRLSELFGQLPDQVANFWCHWVSVPWTNRNKSNLNRLILNIGIVDKLVCYRVSKCTFPQKLKWNFRRSKNDTIKL